MQLSDLLGNKPLWEQECQAAREGKKGAEHQAKERCFRIAF